MYYFLSIFIGLFTKLITLVRSQFMFLKYTVTLKVIVIFLVKLFVHYLITKCRKFEKFVLNLILNILSLVVLFVSSSEYIFNLYLSHILFYLLLYLCPITQSIYLLFCLYAFNLSVSVYLFIYLLTCRVVLFNYFNYFCTNLFTNIYTSLILLIFNNMNIKPSLYGSCQIYLKYSKIRKCDWAWIALVCYHICNSEKHFQPKYSAFKKSGFEIIFLLMSCTGSVKFNYYFLIFQILIDMSSLLAKRQSNNFLKIVLFSSFFDYVLFILFNCAKEIFDKTIMYDNLYLNNGIL